jgi:hypothetical protein
MDKLTVVKKKPTYQYNYNKSGKEYSGLSGCVHRHDDLVLTDENSWWCPKCLIHRYKAYKEELKRADEEGVKRVPVKDLLKERKKRDKKQGRCKHQKQEAINGSWWCCDCGKKLEPVNKTSCTHPYGLQRIQDDGFWHCGSCGLKLDKAGVAEWQYYQQRQKEKAKK